MNPEQPELLIPDATPAAGPGPVVTLPPAVAAVMTPMELLSIAIQKGADLAQMEKLMDLQERWERNEARKAFYAALAAFKAAPPTITKNKTVDFSTSKGRTTYDHATLDEVALKIGAALAPHGLSFRWEPSQAQGRIRVTCYLQHVLGHTESVFLEGPADDSGNKNAIQQVGSTVTYLQRYTLLSITGMAVQDQDDDGRGSSDPAAPAQLQELLDAITEAKDIPSLSAAFNAAYKVAEASGSESAKRDVMDAKNVRQAQLKGASR